MKLVYLAGAISKGNIVHNVAQADRAMYELMVAGVAVINPMLSCYCGAAVEDTNYSPHAKARWLFQTCTHEQWLDMDKEIVGRCDAVLRLPGDSNGADIETAHALSKGIPVFHNVGELIQWSKA